MIEYLGKILCKFGLHDHYRCATVEQEDSGDLFAVIKEKCEKCGEKETFGGEFTGASGNVLIKERENPQPYPMPMLLGPGIDEDDYVEPFFFGQTYIEEHPVDKIEHIEG